MDDKHLNFDGFDDLDEEYRDSILPKDVVEVVFDDENEIVSFTYQYAVSQKILNNIVSGIQKIFDKENKINQEKIMYNLKNWKEGRPDKIIYMSLPFEKYHEYLGAKRESNTNISNDSR